MERDPGEPRGGGHRRHRERQPRVPKPSGDYRDRHTLEMHPSCALHKRADDAGYRAIERRFGERPRLLLSERNYHPQVLTGYGHVIEGSKLTDCDSSPLQQVGEVGRP
jgi:hypothetical protein